MDRRKFLLRSSSVTLSSLASRILRAAEPRSQISNSWRKVEPKKLSLDEICVFRGSPGSAYNHHPEILCDRGRLYASWSNGPINEDDYGQRMLVSTSDDGGATWSAPSTITPAPPQKTSAFTAMGIRTYRGKLVATYGHYAYTDLVSDGSGEPPIRFTAQYGDDLQKKVHHDTYTETRISEDHGATWGKPFRIIDRFVPNLRPFPTRSGRLIITGNITFPYTDDPSGMRNWKVAGIPRLPGWAVDDSEGFNKVCGYRHDAQKYCEASFFQTDDDVIHMMLRTVPLKGEKHNGLLAVTESRDNGLTWSEPLLTNYSDCCCRFQFGRLPDGRYFGLSCPDPKGQRTPLVLSTSKDGIRFDRNYILGDLQGFHQRIPGVAKGSGAYGYPSCDIADNTMHVVYSRTKEDIYYMKLDLRLLA